MPYRQHRLALAVRDVFTRLVGCPACGALALAPCIGISEMLVGVEMQFSHIQRLVLANTELIDQIPFIAS